MSHEADLTPLQVGAVQIHEAYEAWIAAGFTEEQSFQMVLAVLAKPS